MSMVWITRSICIVLLAGTALLAFGQGSAGGYGQSAGGFGGGGFGSRGGNGFRLNGGQGLVPSAPNMPADRAQEDKKARPDEDDTYPVWESKSAILSPGDRVEFKLKVKKGETLLAGATSDAFDPALSVEDSKGTVLFKNDDRAEGDQAPFVVYRFPEEGNYVLKVLSYGKTSGGKFTLKMRTFIASDAGLGVKKHDDVIPTVKQNSSLIDFRLSAKKGKIYDLGSVVTLGRDRRYDSQLARIVGPTGVEEKDFKMVPTSEPIPVFMALADGDYYLEFTAGDGKEYETAFKEVTVIPVRATGEVSVDYAANELKVFEFVVKPDQIIRTTISGPTSLRSALSVPGGDPSRFQTEGDESYGNNPFYLWFKMNRDSEFDVVRVFHGEGTARFAIRLGSDRPERVTFKNTESVPAWEPGNPLKYSIEIGDSRILLVKSSKSELMRVNAGASHFQPRLDIFRLNGEMANSLCNRVAHTAADDLYFPDADTFLVRLSCDGHGGSGDSNMKRDTLSASPYALGTSQELKLDGVNFGLYSVTLEAGKRYQLMVDHPESFLRTDLLDDDGQFLVSQRIVFDKVAVEYFVPTKSGKHRLWLRGAPGERHFRFEVHVAPSIGG